MVSNKIEVLHKMVLFIVLQQCVIFAHIIQVYFTGTKAVPIAREMIPNYSMTVWILAGNYISFTIAAGLISLHMPGVV